MFRGTNAQAGVTAIEYALIASLISIVALLAFAVMTGSLSGNYYRLMGELAETLG